MKNQKQIREEIERLDDLVYKNIPCGKKHKNYFRENGFLKAKEVDCATGNLCGYCKRKITHSINRRLKAQLKWVLEEL